MRTTTLKLAGSEIECSLSWKTMKSITKEIADPVFIAQEVQKQIKADEDGREYESKVTFNTDSCVKMIAIAADMDEDDVGDLFMEGGVVSGQAEAGKLLVALLGEGDEGTKVGKPKARKK